MKKSIILLGLILSMSILSSNNSLAQNQKAQDSYIETTEFHKYASQNGHASTKYQYNDINQLTLSFTNFGDSIINICLYEYDKNGNIIKNSSLSLQKDKKNPDKYYCKNCLFTNEKLLEIKDKVIEQLNKK
ncbi:MAG: hypothetical protein MUF50_01540 [Planctomycetes bacterium]|nr:hypothetical protein [Planctomycetota bacterium]